MDVLGQEVALGDIALFSAVKSSGFRVAVVCKVGEKRVNLIGGYDSRKDNDNFLIISEEQYISKMSRNIVTNENGMVDVRKWVRYNDRPGGEYEESVLTVEERLLEITHSIIMLSRTIKGEELGEYEPTQEEVERYKL